MPTPFPGMDPYLERPDLWPNVHSSLIVALRDDLAPRLRPRYYVSVEERIYLVRPDELTFVARPDAAIVGETKPLYQPVAPTAVSTPVTVELPMPDVVTERYLQIQAADSGRIVTVLEILSPANKRPGKGRTLYERKRLALFSTRTHLVEIDLLRMGEPFTMGGAGQLSDYRILVSREEKRPFADLFPFSLRDAIPAFAIPLLPGDDEPEVSLGPHLHAIYDRAGYDLRLDYEQGPTPPLEGDNAAWVDTLLQKVQLR